MTADALTTPVQIEVWADFACPWCFIGSVRLDAAITAFAAEGGIAEVRHRAYQLSPDAPVSTERSAAAQLADHLGVDEGQARAMQAHVSTIAAGEGLAYDFERLQPTNTRAAHRLAVGAGGTAGRRDLVRRIYAAHFEQGRSIGDPQELAALAQASGVDVEPASDADVEADISAARAIGVTGVPFVVFNHQLAVAGAQETDVMLGALRQARDEALA